MSPSSTRPGESPARTVVVAVVALSLVFVAWLALAGRGNVLLYGDEHLSVRNLHASWGEALGLYDKRGTGVAFLLLQKLAVDLLGAGPLAYRLPALLGALVAVLVAYPVGRRLVGPTAALVAVPLLATTSIFLYYARFGRAYGLIVPLVLLFVGAVHDALRDEWPRVRPHLRLALWGGLLPWVHLSTIVPVAAVGASAIVVTLAGRDPVRRRRATALAGALALAGGLALLLFAPAWGAMREFVDAKAGAGRLEFGALDVAALLPGQRAVGAVWLLGVPAALVWILIRGRGGAVVLAAAALAPVAGLLVTRPAGGVYAFARYLVSGLPFYAMLLAWLAVELVHLAPLARGAARNATRAALGVGLVLVAGAFWAGPVARGRATTGPFAATSLSLLPLPPFDAPWDGMPEFYRTLARSPEPLRIIEVPEQVSRSALLYRNYWLTHGKDVVMGFVLARSPEHVPAGPYVRLTEDAVLDADYLVLHKAIDQELAAYWRWVHARVWPERDEPELAPYMRAFGNFGTRVQDRSVWLHGLGRLGEPVYSDRFVDVWQLSQPPR